MQDRDLDPEYADEAEQEHLDRSRDEEREEEASVADADRRFDDIQDAEVLADTLLSTADMQLARAMARGMDLIDKAIQKDRINAINADLARRPQTWRK